MNLKTKNLSEELINSNIKPSHQRIKILEYLDACQSHPTVDQIFNDLQKEMPTLSKSTVYNTLNAFVHAQLVREITIEDNEVRYELQIKNHGHFKCEACDTIYDFNIDIDSVTTDGLKEFKINDKSVYFKGICKRCLKDNK